MSEDGVKQRHDKNKTCENDNNEQHTTEQDEMTKPSTSEKITGVFSRFVESFEGALQNVLETSSGRKKLNTLSIEGVAEYIKLHKPQNIIVMTGAGISTSAGIPDFRSPDTGLYDNLQEYNLSDPMEIFSLPYFLRNPEPFYSVARKMFPKDIKPTPTHYFVQLLAKKKILRRWFTQNIDGLEHMTGVAEDLIVEAHGSHRISTCLKCRKKYDLKWIEDELDKEGVKYPKCVQCEGIVKPDITFFGENLPGRFFKCAISDFPKCDLLIIMGTSLVVQPFAGLIGEVAGDVPRLLINLEEAGQIGKSEMASEGLCYGHKSNTRDVFLKKKCDDGVKHLAELLDWELELEALIQEGEARHAAKLNSQ
ncbi:unnamed protein product [Auanema sp. JU1783]|nr:unnamed protein product [Auanema sp. JU1783]